MGTCQLRSKSGITLERIKGAGFGRRPGIDLTGSILLLRRIGIGYGPADGSGLTATQKEDLIQFFQGYASGQIQRYQGRDLKDLSLNDDIRALEEADARVYRACLAAGGEDLGQKPGIWDVVTGRTRSRPPSSGSPGANGAGSQVLPGQAEPERATWDPQLVIGGSLAAAALAAYWLL